MKFLYCVSLKRRHKRVYSSHKKLITKIMRRVKVNLLDRCHLKATFQKKNKKDVNRDSHIASSPISQSSFFKGVRCLIFASSQRKLRGYIEFL